MEVLHHPGPQQPVEGGSVVTIGAYDGVHLGHRRLIAQVKQLAEASGLTSTVVTFDRHPATVVRPASAPRLLTDLDQKLELLASTGVDRTLVVHFDRERSEEMAEDFVSEVLVNRLGVKALIVGENFHFGHDRQGNVPLLRKMGEELGFSVTGISLVDIDGSGIAVSSTRIRQLLQEGAVEKAAALLGRDHEVRGVVRHGDHRGRELGYPTANVSVPADIQLPADGVYAGWYHRPDGSRHGAAVSLGRRPTFYEEPNAELLVEAFLLDFDGDLYGEIGRVSFRGRLRGQQRFSSADELVTQMAKDVDAARDSLALRR